MKKRYLAAVLLIILVVGGIYFYKYRTNAITPNHKTVKSNTVAQGNKLNGTSKNSNEIINSTQPSANSSNGTSTTSQTQPNNNSDTVAKVKNYLLNGQNNLSSAERLNWSKRFLDQVDINSLYKQYAATGGNANNIQDFAKYITSNAPMQSNWQVLFKEDLKDEYGSKITIVKIVYLGDNLYQTYISQEGTEVPFVVVSAKTGYFHG